MKRLAGNIVDVVNQRIFKGYVEIEKGRIVCIKNDEGVTNTEYIMPGLVDAHVHIESAMLIPSEFARLASVHGTVATVSDPHEIANVLGVDGVRFMIENGKKVPMKFFFGAPSCVPATDYETSGARLDSNDVESLMRLPEVKFLGEVMNFPGVLQQEADLMKKLAITKKYRKVVDGHFPYADEASLQSYVAAGISTDHECSTLEEARMKVRNGMMIQIREGSAARDFEALLPLLKESSDRIMFCSDDKHPDELVEGHLNVLLKRALAAGYDFMDVIRAMSLIPVSHYNLEVGLLQLDDPADLMVVDNLKDFKVLEVYIDGVKVAEKGDSLIASVEEQPLNVFNANRLKVADVQLPLTNPSAELKVIGLQDGLLRTSFLIKKPLVTDDGMVVSDTERDILKLVVLNRYKQAKPAIGFIQGFGLKNGALASTIAHDSHNLIAVGTSDALITKAINALIEQKGGIAVSDEEATLLLPLPYAGLMSGDDGKQVAATYQQLDAAAKKMGSSLSAPFMSLSFMALLVIPELKLSDKGLFDAENFRLTGIFC